LKPALAIGDKQLAGNDATTLDCGCAGESNHDHAHAHTHTHADSRDADAAAQAFANATETPFEPGRVATQTLRLKPLESLPVGLRVSLPPGAKPGASYRLDLVQRENGKVVGGVALTIRAK